MVRKCALLALVLTCCTTAAAFAQSSAEYGRASGGQIELGLKAPSRFSGSLGLTMFGSKGYGATLGGTLIKDRLWFFAAADHAVMRFPSTVASIPRFSSNILADLGDRNSFGASFRTQTNVVPSSFLSLRYTGIVSSNMFVTASVSRNAH